MIEPEDLKLVHLFEECRLPVEAWTHEAHLRVAYVYLCHHGLEKSIDKLRRGILRFNASLGRYESYHETITVAMTRLLWCRLSGSPRPWSFEQLKASHPDLFVWEPPALLKYYSKARLQSARARRVFLEPDRKALDRSTRSSEHRRVFLETPSGSKYRAHDARQVISLLKQVDPGLNLHPEPTDAYALVVPARQLRRLGRALRGSTRLAKGLRVISLDGEVFYGRFE